MVILPSSTDWWYVADSKGTKGWAPASFFSLCKGKDFGSPVPPKEEIDLLQRSISGESRICNTTHNTIPSTWTKYASYAYDDYVILN